MISGNLRPKQCKSYYISGYNPNRVPVRANNIKLRGLCFNLGAHKAIVNMSFDLLIVQSQSRSNK